MEPQLPADPSANLPRTRDYQQEMLEESLRNNLIIALDTGSGKTHIAVLRMKIEAEREAKKVRSEQIMKVAQATYHIVADFLVHRTHCGVMRTTELCDIAGSPGLSRADLRRPRAQPMERS